MRRSSGRLASASAVKVNNVRFGSLPTPKRAKHVARLVPTADKLSNKPPPP